MQTLRFTILEHIHPAGIHWDLLLQQPGTDALATWSVPISPEDFGEISGRATRIPDHRGIYLDYEGEISGGRGEVRRWDTGTYILLACDEKNWDILLHGERIAGRVCLDTSEGDVFVV